MDKKNALHVVMDVIKDVQLATGHVTRMEMTVNLEGLNVMLKIFNNAQGKVYGIERNISLRQLAEGVPEDILIGIRNDVLNAIKEAEKNASTEREGTGHGKES